MGVPVFLPGGFDFPPNYIALGCFSHVLTPNLVTPNDLCGSQAIACVV